MFKHKMIIDLLTINSVMIINSLMIENSDKAKQSNGSGLFKKKGN